GPPGRAVEVVVLPAVERPQEGRKPEQAKRKRHRHQIDQDFHQPISRADGLARSAFAVTRSEEPDMASAATSGEAKPRIARGRARKWSPAASHRLARMTRRAFLAIASAAATGASRSLKKTASAVACDRWTDVTGESDTSAAASEGASLRPSPTI